MTVIFNNEAKFTGIYFHDLPDETPKNNHVYTSEITTPATHLNEGIITYTCTCGDNYTEVIAKTTEHSYTSDLISNAGCTKDGLIEHSCACGDSYGELVPATGHIDNNKDGVCDNCGNVNCSHICHQSGFMGFIWKIVLLFSKLFGTNPVCECGVAHY